MSSARWGDRGVGAGGEREASAQLLRVRIRHFRHQRGLSPERPAEAVDRDRQTVGLWERAVTPPTVDDLSALARALQVQTWRLFYG
ncbi:helix-turn-helix transcriptional regulator [Kitasatospora griseola]|uniref:helix-turn-helix transcriptional regulator n=1 Tax=Kitasatospora griseola TaxID=2064 RepID=UPI0016702087